MVPEDAAAVPAPDPRPVEAIVGWHTARRAVVIAPVLVVAAGLLSGPGAAVAALVGVAVVAGNFVLGGAMLSVAARASLGMYHAAALFGFFIRLGLITVTMLLLAELTGIDRTALGISVVLSYLALLSWEAVAVARGAERELEWSS